jgi:hypothetical protein
LQRNGAFGLALTEGGVLVWLHDLDGWAAGIADALRPCGRFFLSEGRSRRQAFVWRRSTSVPETGAAPTGTFPVRSRFSRRKTLDRAGPDEKRADA